MSEDKKKLLGEMLVDKQVITEQEAAASIAEPEAVKQRLGDILISKNVISAEHLAEALEEQKKTAKRIGDILVAKGYATQQDILDAFSLQLSGRRAAAAEMEKPTLVSRLRTARIPIKMRFAVLITLLIVFTMLVMSGVFFYTQKDEFIRQTTKFGTTIVNNLSHNSSIPLLENDEAALHILLEDISKLEDITYAMIVDRKGVIVAHTDIGSIDKAYAPPAGIVSVEENELVKIARYKSSGVEVLDFGKPVRFNNVAVGDIHVGISLKSLQNKIFRARLFVLGLTVVLIGIGIGVSFSISTLFSKPIHNLLEGTRQIARGNFGFSVQTLRNDELGDLTTAFNSMADGLRKKDIIQDAFGKYVTPEIVNMILQNPDEKWFKGKTVNATVMFADIRGFTSYSEKTSADKVVNTLNDYFSMVTEVIMKHGGHVDKFIGDEIMSIFGLLMEYDDHEARAVGSAVALQRELIAFNDQFRTYTGTDIRIGIGINSGELIAGNIGSKKRMEYTVIGDTVNLASRLTRLAGPGEVIVSEATFAALGGGVEAERLDPVAVKGKSKLVQAYRIKV